MKEINAFDLLDEASQYTNRSVIGAFVRMADRLVGWGQVYGDVPAGYEKLRYYILNRLDGIDETQKESMKFIPVSQYAKQLSKSGKTISEQQLLEELVGADLLSPDEECDELKIIGAPQEAIDKGYIAFENGKPMISPSGIFAYQERKRGNRRNFIPF